MCSTETTPVLPSSPVVPNSIPNLDDVLHDMTPKLDFLLDKLKTFNEVKKKKEKVVEFLRCIEEKKKRKKIQYLRECRQYFSTHSNTAAERHNQELKQEHDQPEVEDTIEEKPLASMEDSFNMNRMIEETPLEDRLKTSGFKSRTTVKVETEKKRKSKRHSKYDISSSSDSESPDLNRIFARRNEETKKAVFGDPEATRPPVRRTERQLVGERSVSRERTAG